MDATRLVRAVDEVLAHLVRLELPVVSLLRPGLDGTKLRNLEAKLPFSLTEELRALYRWRDGTRNQGVLGNMWFFPGFHLLSLEDAVREWESRKDAPQWRSGWFPLFANGAGDFYVVPCSTKRDDSNHVIGLMHGEPDEEVEYQSVTLMIETFAACFASGAFFVGADGTLDMNDEEHRRIRKAIETGKKPPRAKKRPVSKLKRVTLKARSLAQQTALRGDVESAVAQFADHLAAGEHGAAASLAAIDAFQGRWSEALSHAYTFLKHPRSAFASNVFTEMTNLVALSGLKNGGWSEIHHELSNIRDQLEQDRATSGYVKMTDQLLELARSGGESQYVWDWGNHSQLGEDERAAQFDDAVLTLDSKKGFFKNADHRRSHHFGLASTYCSYRSAVKLHDAQEMLLYDEEKKTGLALFSAWSFTASALARAGRAEEAWKVVTKGFSTWWPVDVAQVAPVELLTDEGLRSLMTRERCEWALRTPRGPEARRNAAVG